ncbi:MAG TPA: class I SAM-dependent methyltransferase [Parafilimonas sp.]|jgi:ubiquinone/menaquinone biosynthesis C-methylase UbiE
MANNYNGIARFYDVISRFVYQNSIVKAQVFLIQFIAENNKVLIVGGGTGWILEEISKLNKPNISIMYVEKSSAMIALAKKRNYKNIEVNFIEKGIEDYISAEQFDVIITPFLFDNFLKDKIDVVFKQLNTLLKQNGIWLYADFVNDKTNKKLWQQFLLKTMYLFFRLTANIETQKLIDMRPYFANNYTLISQLFFYRNFIQAIAFKKVK